MNIRYVLRKNVDSRHPVKAYPWCVFDLEARQMVAFGSEGKMRDWAEQLNEKGYVQAS